MSCRRACVHEKSHISMEMGRGRGERIPGGARDPNRGTGVSRRNFFIKNKKKGNMVAHRAHTAREVGKENIPKIRILSGEQDSILILTIFHLVLYCLLLSNCSHRVLLHQFAVCQLMECMEGRSVVGRL